MAEPAWSAPKVPSWACRNPELMHVAVLRCTMCAGLPLQLIPRHACPGKMGQEAGVTLGGVAASSEITDGASSWSGSLFLRRGLPARGAWGASFAREHIGAQIAGNQRRRQLALFSARTWLRLHVQGLLCSPRLWRQHFVDREADPGPGLCVPSC